MGAVYHRAARDSDDSAAGFGQHLIVLLAPIVSRIRFLIKERADFAVEWIVRGQRSPYLSEQDNFCES